MSDTMIETQIDATNHASKSSQRVLEWLGCILSLAGAFLLATHTQLSRYGWLAYLVANIALIAFARRIRAHGLLLQQIGFLATSILGIYKAFVAS